MAPESLLQFGALGVLALVLMGIGKFVNTLNARMERVEGTLVRLTCAVIMAAKLNPEDVDRLVPAPPADTHGGSTMRSLLLLLLLVLGLVLPGCSGWSGIGLPRVGCEIGGDGTAAGTGGGAAADVARSRLAPAAAAPAFAPAAPAPQAPPIIIINARDGEARRVEAQPAPPVALHEQRARRTVVGPAGRPPAEDVEIVPLVEPCTGADGLCRAP